MHLNILSCLAGLSISTLAAAQRSFTVPVNYDNEITVSYYFRENNDLVSVSANDEGLQISVNANDADICKILSSGMVVYAPSGQQNTLLSWNQYSLFHLAGPDGQPVQWNNINAQNCPFGSLQPSSSASSSQGLSTSSLSSGSSATASVSSLAPSSSSSDSAPSSSFAASSSTPVTGTSSSSAVSPSFGSSSSSESSYSSSSAPVTGSSSSTSSSSTITPAPSGTSNGGSSPTVTQDGIHTIASEYTVTSNGQVYIYTKFYVVSASVGPSTTSISTLRPINPTLDINALTAAGHKRHETPAPTAVNSKRAEIETPAQGAGARNFPSGMLAFFAVLMGMSICLF
ncbi:hypothetical protein ZYGR_0K00690 [Zygosaccharomyces rouxii]|uniref:Uncharacterized protein n=1 Tax=Zygosaccharomyces rouxii TaxID=4956 RepID=A0A1Q2ZYN6_ZYGRO|nr:hypothetical protein ZYGR_0K00690 [Zygosaccharomyces rouxii]